MLIDDFFSDSHQIIKDVQLREIARVRNEANVEIVKLKSALLNKPFTNHNLTAKENLSVRTRKDGGGMNVGNEVER